MSVFWVKKFYLFVYLRNWWFSFQKKVHLQMRYALAFCFESYFYTTCRFSSLFSFLVHYSTIYEYESVFLFLLFLSFSQFCYLWRSTRFSRHSNDRSYDRSSDRSCDRSCERSERSQKSSIIVYSDRSLSDR